MHPDYLEKVLNAQVYDVAIETPLEAAPILSARLHNALLLKRWRLKQVQRRSGGADQANVG